MRRKKTAITQMLEALSDEERLKLFKFVIEVAWDIKCTEAKELWVKQSVRRSNDDASGWHTHEAIEAKLKEKNT